MLFSFRAAVFALVLITAMSTTEDAAAKAEGHTLSIQFCTSCGYNNYYQQLAGKLREAAPHVIVEGGNYPASDTVQNIASALNILSWIVIALLVFGEQIFGAVGIPQPEFLEQFKDNKTMIAITVFFLTRTITQNMMATGAFEVSLDGELIYSKLESGQPPSVGDLFRILADKGIVSRFNDNHN